MANTNDNRVVIRRGARVLTLEELNVVSGNGHVTTTFCTFDPRTDSRDGDCD